jgi:hypothetical protein
LYQALLSDARFHALLLAFDRDLANACRREGCRLCRGVLHSARYRRKPRGRLCKLGEEHDWRFSYCCARDGCRKRATPPSLRFLGRKVYLAAMVALAAIMQHGITEPRIKELHKAARVSRRTVARWRLWWRSTFPATPFWRAARAAFKAPIDEDRLPASLLECFSGDGTPYPAAPGGTLRQLLQYLEAMFADREQERRLAGRDQTSVALECIRRQLITLLHFIKPLTGGREHAQ